MNNKPLRTYEIDAVVLAIGGRIIGGFGESDAIAFESVDPGGEMTVGADGEATFSRYSNAALKCTITVMQSSKGFADLAALAQAQRAESPIEGYSFLCRDTTTGTEIADDQAVFEDVPIPSFGKKVSEIEVVIFLPNGKSNDNLKLGVDIGA